MFWVHWEDGDDYEDYGPFTTREEAWEWATSTLTDHFRIEEEER